MGDGEGCLRSSIAFYDFFLNRWDLIRQELNGGRGKADRTCDSPNVSPLKSASLPSPSSKMSKLKKTKEDYRRRRSGSFPTEPSSPMAPAVRARMAKEREALQTPSFTPGFFVFCCVEPSAVLPCAVNPNSAHLFRKPLSASATPRTKPSRTNVRRLTARPIITLHSWKLKRCSEREPMKN